MSWLRGERPAPADFNQVERLTRHLHSVELLSLLSRIDGEDPLGAKAWVRCAAVAGLAERDPAAALEFVLHPPFGEADPWVSRQIDFSFYRGWAKRDPEASLAHLLEKDPPEDRDDGIVREASARMIFASWVRIDPDAAWRMIAAWPSGSDIPAHAVTAGFFDGLPPIDFPSRAGMLASGWQGRETEARARHLEVVSHIDRWSILPRDEHTPLHVAAVWARYDPDSAFAWFDRCELPDAPDKRRSALMERWASEAPESALEWTLSRRFDDGEFDPAAITGLFLGLAYHDPGIAEPLFELMPPGQRTEALATLANRLARADERDYLPGLPGTRLIISRTDRRAAMENLAGTIRR